MAAEDPQTIIESFKIGTQLRVLESSLIIKRQVAEGSRMYAYVVINEDGAEQILKEIFYQPTWNYQDRIASNCTWKNVHSGSWEFSTQKKLQEHPHITKCFGGQHYSLDRRRFHILMEYAPFGDIRDVVRTYGRVDYATCWRFYGQMVAALGYMHRQGHVHGGVGPRNIFVFTQGAFWSFSILSFSLGPTGSLGRSCWK
ncbi:hypothetical protein L596_025579 [Steinernema carpocapsae]|uniref:Protein kinase domain-containing protein n=1 Tax=Steinernema carpocapsae TaxID=34508 RepID=A0A4U5M875_STECR|nr:hypothetical protein L596_025579 [Steinernema carpocapsae]